METENLRQQYDTIANTYAEVFTQRYYTDPDDCSFLSPDRYWVGNEPGGVFYINDDFHDYDTIRYAVDNNINEDELFEWMNYVSTVLCACEEMKTPTLKEWHTGCNRLTDIEIEKLGRLMDIVTESKCELEKTIMEYRSKYKI